MLVDTQDEEMVQGYFCCNAVDNHSIHSLGRRDQHASVGERGGGLHRTGTTNQAILIHINMVMPQQGLLLI